MTTTTTFEKSIRYDRQSKDFACYLDGEFVGYAASYSAGEALLDQIAYDLLAGGAVLSAAQLELTGPFAPLGECAICGCAAWTTSSDGLLCPDHANVWVEYHEEQASGATCQLDLVVRPRFCGNCGGEHSIQACPEILAALFAPQRPAKRLVLVAALAILAFVLLACAGDATCSPRNDGSRAAATCVMQ